MYLFGNLQTEKQILPMSRFLLPPAPQLRLKVGGADIHRAISRHCGHQTGTRGGRFGCHLSTQGAPRSGAFGGGAPQESCGASKFNPNNWNIHEYTITRLY